MMHSGTHLEPDNMVRLTYSKRPADQPTSRNIVSWGTWLAAAVLAASCKNSPHSLEQRQSDIRAANEVYAKLNSDQVYYYPHVTIRVENGVAHLSGYVWNTQALYHAKDVASTVAGVTAVVDNLKLERDGAR